MNALLAINNPLYTIRTYGNRETNPNGDLDFDEVGAYGSGQVYIKPLGYWSRDPITLYINRNCTWSNDGHSVGEWRVELTHSSGGRSTSPTNKDGSPNPECVVDDLEAEDNFGMALRAAAAYGREILQHTEALEAAYQAEQTRRQAERDAAKAAKLAAIEADAPLGLAAAKKLVAVAKAQVQEYCNTEVIRAYVRGQDNFMTVSVAKTTRTTWYWSGAMIGEDALIAKLAEMSNRTTAA
jgi:hypothetical protein